MKYPINILRGIVSVAQNIRISFPWLTPARQLLGGLSATAQGTNWAEAGCAEGLPGLAPGPAEMGLCAPPLMHALGRPQGACLSSLPTLSPVVLPIPWEMVSSPGCPQTLCSSSL